MNTKTLDPVAVKNANHWLEEPYDEETKAWIKENLKNNPDLINQSFYRDLEFGTGGLRGIMGIGSNRMNVYTIRRATQGLANYLLKQNVEHPSVFIGYDGRKHSYEFALESAKVLAANGIKTFIFKELRPTPLVSYGVRFKKCLSGIMITASHNPPDYNGYKVYWNDGGQVLPPHDIGIIAEVYKLNSLADIKVGDPKSPLITWVLDEIDNSYLSAIEKLRLFKGEVPVKVLYTPLHGTGITLMPEVMKRWGVSHFKTVEKQSKPDGNFTYAPVPNPEEKEALNMGIEELLKEEHDILIANDPDADRVGVAVRHLGKAVILTGNQIASLCLHYLIKNKIDLPANAAFIKTIVTTELFRKIAVLNGYACFDVLTGFKYVAEKIRDWEQSGNPYRFVFGGEESYGYLYGTQTRDKDALIMSALISEMAGFAKKQNKTLIDLRDELFKEYGLFYETLASLKFPESKEGNEAMKKAVGKLRSNPPLKFGDQEVIAIDDYQLREKLDLVTGKKEALTLEQSDVLVFWLKDNSKVMIRPSGTEPKVKIYCGVTTPNYDTVESGLLELEKRALSLINKLKELTL